jgi:hypothetical protein
MCWDWVQRWWMMFGMIGRRRLGVEGCFEEIVMG